MKLFLVENKILNILRFKKDKKWPRTLESDRKGSSRWLLKSRLSHDPSKWITEDEEQCHYHNKRGITSLEKNSRRAKRVVISCRKSKEIAYATNGGREKQVGTTKWRIERGAGE